MRLGLRGLRRRRRHDATKAGDRTVVLFDETGASGATWKATKGKLTGQGKNGSTWVADTRKDCFEKK